MNTDDQMSTRETWLAERAPLVTSTRIVEVLGLGYDGRTAKDVYDEMTTGKRQDRDDLILRASLFLQPFVAGLFTEQTQIAVENREHEVFTDPVDPWMGTSLDYVCRDFSALGPEVKVVWHYAEQMEWGRLSGTDQVPERVIIQTQWQMRVMGFDRSYIAAYFAPHKFKWYLVKADAVLQAKLVEIGHDFYMRVMERRGVEGWRHALTGEVIALAQRVEPGRVQPLGAVDLGRVQEWQAMGVVEKAAKERRGELKQLLQEAMGPAEFGMLPDGSRLKRAMDNNQIWWNGMAALINSAAAKPQLTLSRKPLPEPTDGETLEQMAEREGREALATTAAINPEDFRGKTAQNSPIQ